MFCLAKNNVFGYNNHVGEVMKEPLVAIVGRPNVGKSTLFNRIVGKRISIVNDEPGVTRDRIFSHAEWLDNSFTLIDTGGLDFEKNDEITINIVSQAKLAIEMADVILFVVDGKAGITAEDRNVGRTAPAALRRGRGRGGPARPP